MANQLENIAGLQSILETVNSLPEAGSGGGGVANVTLDISGGISCYYLGTNNTIVKVDPEETIEMQKPNMIFLDSGNNQIYSFEASSDSSEVIRSNSTNKLIAIYGDGSVIAHALSGGN